MGGKGPLKVTKRGVAVENVAFKKSSFGELRMASWRHLQLWKEADSLSRKFRRLIHMHYKVIYACTLVILCLRLYEVKSFITRQWKQIYHQQEDVVPCTIT